MHSIRLRHPWNCEPAGTDMRWTRSFNWPAGIQRGEKAHLVIEGLPTNATVSLSGTKLTCSDNERFEVTEHLELTNRIEIRVPGEDAQEAKECPYEVKLQIVES